MPSLRSASTAAAILSAASVTTTGFAQWDQTAYVDSQGRQWRQLDTTCGLTWNQVAAKCPTDGVTPCTGMIYNQNITGWVWATHAQVQELLVELEAGVGQPDCSTGADATGAVFLYFRSTTNFDLLSRVEGWTSTISTAAGTKGYALTPLVNFDQDYLYGFTCANSISPRSSSSASLGVWLFRPACVADLDFDGAVGPADLSVLLGSWGTGGAADLSGNGSVGAEDLSIMLASWGSDGC